MTAMDIAMVLEALREICPNEPLEPRTMPIDETFITLPPDCVHPAVRLLVERFDLRHLSTITGEDAGPGITLLYHFWAGQGLTLRTVVPRDRPSLATITDLVPGATFYEREASEMLGLTFDGHPDPRRLLLPDDWDSEPPLREQGTAP